MHAISLAYAVHTRGAGNRLACLRKRYCAGLYSWNRFVLLAAEAYLADAKPLRAASLLEAVDKPGLSGDEICWHNVLAHRIGNQPSLPYPDCSLNMIVRNEERTIAAALDSVDAIMDEVVICDTGSEDNTVAQAQMYGARIVRDAWRNDFSRARNAALDASHCAWIFWMDADDRLELASRQPLQALWRSAAKQGAAVCVANQVQGATPVEFLQVRVFPRRPDIRFERSIHEQVMFSIRRAGLPFARYERIRVRHTGYCDAQVHRSKMQRNLVLIGAELLRAPRDPSLLLSLGDSYAALSDTARAIEAYRAVAADQEAFADNPDVFVQAHVNLGLLYMRAKELREAKRFFLRSLYLDPNRLESSYFVGRICLTRGDEKEAARFFARAAGGDACLRLTGNNNTMVRLESLYSLSELLLKWGNYCEAEDLVRSALAQYPLVPQFYTQIGKSLYFRDKLAEAARCFMRSIDLCPAHNDEAYIGMAQIYAAIGNTASAIKFLTRALDNQGNIERIQPHIERLAAALPLAATA